MGGDGVHHGRHSGGCRNPFCFGLRRCRDHRLTSVCFSSTIHGRRLLSFACPKESNQRKRHPRIRALGCAEGSLRADGFGPQGILPCCPNRRDPSRRPRAVHAAGPSVLRRYSEGPEIKSGSTGYMRQTASAAGTAALCSSRAPLGRGEQAQEIARRGARMMRARPISAQGRAVSGPRSLLA